MINKGDPSGCYPLPNNKIGNFMAKIDMVRLEIMILYQGNNQLWVENVRVERLD